MKQMH